MHAQRLLQKGYPGYLCSVLGSSSEDVSITNIPVVRDFFKVFSDELLGMPIDRDIEFHIEVAPRTHLISKAPYSMTPSKLKELKTQLQELLDKGFIRLSLSPWGAPILFVKKDEQLCINHRVLNK